jgi:hypothetical protein
LINRRRFTMYKDYSGSCVAVIGRNRRKNCRRKTIPAAKEFLPAVKLVWHAIGAMLLFTLVLGVTSTIWYGWQVRSALDEIGRAKTANKSLISENKLLTVKHEIMLSQEYMEEAARKQGLSLPSKTQLRYP